LDRLGSRETKDIDAPAGLLDPGAAPGQWA